MKHRIFVCTVSLVLSICFVATTTQNSTAKAESNGPHAVIDEYGSVVDKTIIAGVIVRSAVNTKLVKLLPEPNHLVLVRL